MNQLKVADVDAQLHCGAAKEDLEVTLSEPVFTHHPVLVTDLGGVFQTFDVAKRDGAVLVEIAEVGIGCALHFVEQSCIDTARVDRIRGRDVSAAGFPNQDASVELDIFRIPLSAFAEQSLGCEDIDKLPDKLFVLLNPAQLAGKDSGRSGSGRRG
jgi:hypothetical protein